MNKTLFVTRGLPGSGKSFLAQSIASKLYANDISVYSYNTDDYFMKNGKYKFSYDEVEAWHVDNLSKVKNAILYTPKRAIILDNTHLTYGSIEPFYKIAVEYDYNFIFIEPNTWWKFNINELALRNKHNVSHEVLEGMLSKWEDTADIYVKLMKEYP